MPGIPIGQQPAYVLSTLGTLKSSGWELIEMLRGETLPGRNDHTRSMIERGYRDLAEQAGATSRTRRGLRVASTPTRPRSWDRDATL